MITKFDMPEQFPADEVLNDKDRIVRGWMSVEAKDRQGDVIPVSEFKKTLNTWMKRGAPITDSHSNRVIGKGLNWTIEEHKKTKQPGILLDYQIFDDYSIDNSSWDEIKSGKRKGLSFGGRATNESEEVKDSYSGQKAQKLTGIEAYEVASVADPANQFAENTHVNFLAKSNTKNEYETLLMKDLQMGFSGEIQKPFAGFTDFDTCVKSQLERGHSEESGERICGWLKHKLEKQVADGEEDDAIMENDGSALGKTEANKSDNMEGKSLGEKVNKVEADTSVLKTIDEKVKSLEEKIDKIAKALEKQDEEEKKPKDDEEKKKQDEEEEKPEDEEKKKEDKDEKKPEETEKEDVNPPKEGGTVVLPKADAGETDETAKPEADKVQIMEKNISEAVEKAITKGFSNIRKVSAPSRPETKLIEKRNEQKLDFGLDLMKRVRKGELSFADMNRETKNFIIKRRDEGMKEFLDSKE